jgi:hypothetical protein
VYLLLSRLKALGLVRSVWVESDAGHPRKYFACPTAKNAHGIASIRMESPREPVILGCAQCQGRTQSDSKSALLFTQSGLFCVQNFSPAIVAIRAANTHCCARAVRFPFEIEEKSAVFSRFDIKFCTCVCVRGCLTTVRLFH